VDTETVYSGMTCYTTYCDHTSTADAILLQQKRGTFNITSCNTQLTQ